MRYFNKRHRVNDLNKLAPGDQVTDQKVSGTVVEEHSTPRSYQVDLPHGTLRRNRHFIIPIYVKEAGSQLSEKITETQNALAPQIKYVRPKGSVTRTRSGRPVVKPKRLDS